MQVARFSATDIESVADILRGAYSILSCAEPLSDSSTKLMLGDFISALDECDSIQIVEDEEVLVDEG